MHSLNITSDPVSPAAEQPANAATQIREATDDVITRFMRSTYRVSSRIGDGAGLLDCRLATWGAVGLKRGGTLSDLRTKRLLSTD